MGILLEFESVALRSFAAGDFETLFEIDQRCYPPEIAYSRREFRWYLRLPGAEVIIAEVRGAIAGFILTACFERSGHIVTIDVLGEFRRAGVGTALLHAAEGIWRVRVRGKSSLKPRLTTMRRFNFG